MHKETCGFSHRLHEACHFEINIGGMKMENEKQCCKSGNCESNNCKSENYKHHGECDTGCEMSNHMVRIADNAWECLMAEKMKAHWEKLMGSKMNEIAAASVETSMAYHMNMVKGKMEVEASAKKIQQAMSSK